MDPEKDIIVLKRLEGNEVAHLKGLQVWLAPHADFIVMFWWVVWVTTLLIVLYRVVKEVRR